MGSKCRLLMNMERDYALWFLTNSPTNTRYIGYTLEVDDAKWRLHVVLWSSWNFSQIYDDYLFLDYWLKMTTSIRSFVIIIIISVGTRIVQCKYIYIIDPLDWKVCVHCEILMGDDEWKRYIFFREDRWVRRFCSSLRTAGCWRPKCLSRTEN